MTNPKLKPVTKKPVEKKKPENKSSLIFSLYFTASKVLGYVIFIVGSIFAFINKDPNIFIFSSSIAAGLLGLKTWQSSALEKKRFEFGDNGSGGNGGNGTIAPGLEDNGESQSDIPPPPPVGDEHHHGKPNEEIG